MFCLKLCDICAVAPGSPSYQNIRDLQVNFKELNTYFNFIFISATDFCITKGIHRFFGCLKIMYKTLLYKGSLRLQKNGYVWKTKVLSS